MSELAEELIAQNLKTKKTTLDLGYCGLNGTEDDLYKPLRDATYLKSLSFSNEWTEYNPRKQAWIAKFSKNNDDNSPNILLKIPDTLPSSLQKLILAGDMEFDRYDMRFTDYRFKIKDFSVLADLQNLKFLDLSYGNIQDISFLVQLKKLQSLNLNFNPIKNIEVLKSIKTLKAVQVGVENLSYPPIWLVKLVYQKGKLGSYTNLPELAEVAKIWQLLISDDEENVNLAHKVGRKIDR